MRRELRGAKADRKGVKRSTTSRGRWLELLNPWSHWTQVLRPRELTCVVSMAVVPPKRAPSPPIDSAPVVANFGLPPDFRR